MPVPAKLGRITTLPVAVAPAAMSPTAQRYDGVAPNPPAEMIVQAEPPTVDALASAPNTPSARRTTRLAVSGEPLWMVIG